MKNRRKQIAGLTAAVLAVVALLGFLVWSGHREAVRGAEIVSRNYAAILDARLDATLRRADADLQELADVVPAPALSEGAVPRYAREVDAAIASRLRDFPEIAGLRVFDANGAWLYPSGGDAVTRLKPNVEDRDFFNQLRASPELRRVFSDAIFALTTGRPVVVLARSLRDGQGVFRGVAVATINLDYFQGLFKALKIGDGGVVSIFRSDNFKQVLRWPSLDGSINKPLPPENPTRKVLVPGTRTATNRIVASTDGRERIYSHHVLENYPFFVSVGIARDDAVAEWKVRSLIVGVAGLSFLALIIGLFHRSLRAESVSAERDAWFGAAFEQAAVGMALRDIAPHSPRWLRVNQKLCDILGYTRDELLQMSSIELTPAEDREAANKINERLLQGEMTNLTREKRYVRKDGEVIWARLSLSTILGADGRPSHIISVIEDISERKRSEEVRALLAAIVNGSNDAIVSRTPDRRILSWNPAAERMFGYAAEEMVGRSSTLIVPPDREHEAMRSRELLAQGKPVTNLETVRLAKDGRRIDVSLSQSPIHDGGSLVGVAMIFRDISEQQRAREMMRETKDTLAAIIDASMDAIIAVDKDERVMLFSSAAEALFQVSAAEVIGQGLERFIPARFRDGHHAHMRRFAEAGISSRAMGQFSQVTALRQDGSEFPIEASISHTARSGRQLFTVTVRDISRRKQAEAAHAALEAQLREAQKMEAIGTLAGGIAHDFNNIIAAILGNAELALEDASAIPEARESIEEIRKAAQRARELVQQILAFSRRQPTARKRISLATVVDESARLLRAMLTARVSIDVHCAEDAPEVLADSTQLQQVVINLGMNAMQAMVGRQGRITICLDAVVLDTAAADKYPQLRELHALHPGRAARLMVTDDAAGMDAATLKRIFEPFFTTKPAGEGTGLGLSVVHGIVQAHDGAIVVTSEPGAGTTFAIYFPAATAQEGNPVPARIAAGAALASAGSRRILYLDDEDALVFLVKRLLERRGYRVNGCTDPRVAVELVRADPDSFDLVVTDYNMPGMSGLDVAMEMRRIRADLPVVIASGFVDEALQKNAGAAGVREVIFKATELTDFCAVIERLALTPRDEVHAS